MLWTSVSISHGLLLTVPCACDAPPLPPPAHAHSPRPPCPPPVLDDSANALFMTEIVRGMAYTIKAFFEPKVTVRSENKLQAVLRWRAVCHCDLNLTCGNCFCWCHQALSSQHRGSLSKSCSWQRAWRKGTTSASAAKQACILCVTDLLPPSCDHQKALQLVLWLVPPVTDTALRLPVLTPCVCCVLCFAFVPLFLCP